MQQLLTAVVLVTSLWLHSLNARQGFGYGEQDWGHITVRKGAHIFYWLYYTTAANISHYTERPLVIWLQGGPGSESTSYGNFAEIGAMDLQGKRRNHSWVNHMNILFVDQPVGTGFSYVEVDASYARSDKQAAQDLLEFIKGFLAKHAEFQDLPLYIFSQSYGSKLSVQLALKMHQAVAAAELNCDLRSVNLGSPWISPIDSMRAWAPLLLHMGFVDMKGYEAVAASTEEIRHLVQAHRWVEASDKYWDTQDIVLDETNDVSFYNILEKPEDTLQQEHKIMSGLVQQSLNLSKNLEFVALSNAALKMLSKDFMKPAVHLVRKLLDTTNVKVNVYSGQLDLICATVGTTNWIEHMIWANKQSYVQADRVPIMINGRLEGFKKQGENFGMFWIMRAGHSAPLDNPKAMSVILKHITTFG